MPKVGCLVPCESPLILFELEEGRIDDALILILLFLLLGKSKGEANTVYVYRTDVPSNIWNWDWGA